MKTIYRMKWISIFLCLPAFPYARVTPVSSKLVREGDECLAILPSFHITPFECLSSYIQATSLLKTHSTWYPSSWVFLCRFILQAQILDSPGPYRHFRDPQGKQAGWGPQECYCLPPWQSGKGCKAQCTEPQEMLITSSNIFHVGLSQK